MSVACTGYLGKSNQTRLPALGGSFLKALRRACPINTQKLLANNGKEFTDRLFTRRAREASGGHALEQRYLACGIARRSTMPRKPKANGMLERFNGHVADILKTIRLSGAEEVAQTLMRFVALENHQLPQSALKSNKSIQDMKLW